jgi:hypothetical protein
MKKITFIIYLLLINCLRAAELPPADHLFGIIASDP